MERLTSVCLGLGVLLLAGWAAQLTGTPLPPAPEADGQHLSERVAAKGVQIYECRATANAPAQRVFVAPEAWVPYTVDYLLYAS